MSSTIRDIPPAEAGGLLTIDLNALSNNWRHLKVLSKTAECAAVLKANAYGIGIEQAAPVLATAGCKTFFVAHLSEACDVRRFAPQATIYVLNGLFPQTGHTYINQQLRPVLGSLPEIKEWIAFCTAKNESLPAALHVDTGMSRHGISPAEAYAIAQGPLRAKLNISLLMSHFSSSEERDNPVNQTQIDLFQEIRSLFPDVPASLANSSGIFLSQEVHFDLTRPGYALYGGNPCPGKSNPMQPVVRLEGRVVQIRSAPKGTSVGYNGRWTATSDSRLAVISVGYADGYPRSASGTAEKQNNGLPSGAALIDGHLCPFVGTISMDLTIIDVSCIKPDKLAPGDLVTLIGDDLTLDVVGKKAGTIGYEILTNLGSRYARRYIGGAQ